MKQNVLKITTEEQLVAVRNGLCFATPTFTCPKCGSHNVDGHEDCGHISNYWNCTCKDCGHRWQW